MSDKYKWIRTAITVGGLIVAISISYATLKSDVDTVKATVKDKLNKETFTEFKDRQEKKFDEFKETQEAIKEDILEIKLFNAKIEEQLKQILKAVNK